MQKKGTAPRAVQAGEPAPDSGAANAPEQGPEHEGAGPDASTALTTFTPGGA